MGMHLCILDEKQNDVPDWDFIRQANDREFTDMISEVECTKCINIDEYDSMFRLDINQFRKAIKNSGWSDYSIERYNHMADLLEKNKNYYIYLSY